MTSALTNSSTPRAPRSVDGILFVLRTGIPWELLPLEMGCGFAMTKSAKDQAQNVATNQMDAEMVEFRSNCSKKATLVKLRYFAGLTTQEAAEAIGVSRATADRYWTFARTWLHARLKVSD